MKTAIIYASSHGSTGKVAHQIAEKLESEKNQIFDLKEESNIDLSEFDRVIIGGSIHAGQIQVRVKKFCNQNMITLLQKHLGLFICGMNEPEFEIEFNNAFPELLRKHATSSKVIGGEFLFEKMNFFQRVIVRKISGINQSVSRIKEDKIEEMVKEMNNI